MKVRNGMTDAILAVGPGHTLREAARAMAQKKVGAAVVNDPEQPGPGIITERDILQRVVAQRRDSGQTPVREVMTTEVVCCEPRTPIEEVRGVMKNRRIRHLPVVENGALLSMISVRDLLREELHARREEIRYLKEYMFHAPTEAVQA